MNDFSVQDPVTLVRMSGQDIVYAIVKELRGDLMQDMSKLPPGTIVPMSEKEFKDYQSQLAMQATTKMVVPTKPSAEEFARDFETYRSIQASIDKCMPDSIMDIQGKPFRKKSYWRAVAVAFNLHVEPVADEFFEVGDNQPGRDGDWGYKVTYRATTPSGRVAYGDGTCMHSDKLVYDWDYKKDPRVRLGVNKVKTEDNATHHNVRGHAHTRAYNRAVSNLVGFGEVSAEEMPHDSATAKPRKAPQKPPKAKEQASGGYSGTWDGNLVIGSGKNKGKKWSKLPLHFLEWTQGGKAEGVIVEMGAKELARRAALEGDVVDAEVTREPGNDDDLPFQPRSEDPRYP